MKKAFLALIGVVTLGLSTSAHPATILVSPAAVYPPTVKTYSDFWGRTVVVFEKNPKQITLEAGITGCLFAAVVGVKGVADICVGLGNVIKNSGNQDLLPLGLLEITGATFIGALGYMALNSLSNQA